MTDILHYSDVDLSNMKFKKPYYSSSKFSKIPIKYKKKDFIIQTPKIYIPYDLLFYEKKCFLFLSLSNHKTQGDVGDFYCLVKSIEDLVRRKYTKRACPLRRKRKFSETIKNDIYKNITLKVKIPFFKDDPIIKEKICM